MQDPPPDGQIKAQEGQSQRGVERREKKAGMRPRPGRLSPGLVGKAGLGEGPEPFQVLKVCDQCCLKMLNKHVPGLAGTLELTTLQS